MRRVNVPPDTVAYNSAIDACSIAGDWSEALRLLREMKEGGGGLREMKAAGRGEGALREKQRVGERGAGGGASSFSAPPPDVVSYGGAITACARAGRVDEALELVAELRVNEATVVAAAVRGGGGDGGGGGAGRGAKGGEGLPVPNLVTYSAGLFACLKAGEVPRGAELLDEMIAAGVQPNSIHCDTMVAA